MKLVKLNANSLFRTILSLCNPQNGTFEECEQRWFLLFLGLVSLLVSFLILVITIIVTIFFPKQNSWQLVVVSVLFAVFYFSIFVLGKLEKYSLAGILLSASYFVIGIMSIYSTDRLFPEAVFALCLSFGLLLYLFSCAKGFCGFGLLLLFTLFTGYVLNSHILVELKTSYELRPAIIVLCLSAVFILIQNFRSKRYIQRLLEIEKEKLFIAAQYDLKIEQQAVELNAISMDRLSRISAYAEIGRLAAGIFHDLNNYLTALGINLDRIKITTLKYKNDTHIPFILRDICKALDYVHRIEACINCYRDHFKDTTLKTFFDPMYEINSICGLLDYKIRKSNIKINVSGLVQTKLYGNTTRFYRILKNIICNSIEAYDVTRIKDGITPVGVLDIVISETPLEINIKITDYAGGINPVYLPKVFEPFFTTKDSTQGMGLGLNICREIVEKDFNGGFTLVNNHPVGSSIELTFPFSRVSESCMTTQKHILSR